VPGYPAAGDNYAPRLLAALFPEEVYALLARQIPDLPGISAAERARRRDASCYALLGCDPGDLHLPQAVAAE
jgi:hypothetical protein